MSASKRRIVLALLSVLTAGGIAAVLAAFRQMDHDVEMLLLAGSIETGVLLASLANVIVLRACVYRLVRRPRGAAQAPRGVAADTARSQRQFAWMLGCLAAAAVALPGCAPLRLNFLKRVAETRYWAERGLNVGCDDQGRITRIEGNARELTPEELCRFAELPDLEEISFRSLYDHQLAAVVAPASLTTLGINDSLGFTDAGLEHLQRFPQLKRLDLSRTRITDAGLARIAELKELTDLNLSITDVTDDGLAALTECKQLRRIDLYLTAVTEAGARRLRKALPEATITIGACDIAVKSAVLFYPGFIKLDHLHACGKVQIFGPPPPLAMQAGASVTDAGLQVLNTALELKTLDLRHAAVTDGGMPALFPLKTLERVDLRDTAVTEAGRQQLAKALPDCEILR